MMVERRDERVWKAYDQALGGSQPHYGEGDWWGWWDELTAAIKELFAERDAAWAESEALKEALRSATQFTFPPAGMSPDDPEVFHQEIKVERRGPADRWAVLRLSSVLNDAGEWEYEPQPSSRDDEFKARCRFSLKDALDRARALVGSVPQPESTKESPVCDGGPRCKRHPGAGATHYVQHIDGVEHVFPEIGDDQDGQGSDW